MDFKGSTQISVTSSGLGVIDRPAAANPSRMDLPLPAQGRRLHARYDVAQDTDWLVNYWSASDSLDADSANNRAVRSKIVPRARYESNNNGFMAGMLSSYCDFLVGSGPTLKMKTGNAGFNQAVENLWERWSKKIQLRRKLWCMCHAKVQDGEAFGVAVHNALVNDRVQVDVKLCETEQCQSPHLSYMEEDHIDGIRLHPSGNPRFYNILRYHPGNMQVPFDRMLADEIPADEVLHWFRLERPNQHRGVPEFRSTLNTGAASRRFREATLQAAESVADLNVVFETLLPPDQSPDLYAPMSSLPLEKGMATVAPAGQRPHHIKSEHPSPAYEMFIRTQLNETARPKCIPHNVAAGDSSGYNFASGKLDHQTFYLAITCERMDCDELVLDKLFARFWLNAVEEYGWGGDAAIPPEHSWQWPRHPVADERAQADADDKKLRNGTLSLSRWYDQQGLDFDDELIAMAADYGVTTDEMRAILLRNLLGGPPAKEPPKPEVDNGDETDEVAEDEE